MQIHQNDIEITRRIMAGDEHAFDEFYETYYDRLFRFCLRRVGHIDPVYDLVQQTMEKALKYLKSYRGEASLYTWLCQICRNEIATWFKRPENNLSEHVSIDDNPEIMGILESEGELATVREETRYEFAQIVHLAIDALPAHYADILERKYLHGATVEDISRDLGMSARAAESLLARARRAFRALLDDLMSEQGINSSMTS
ncbi:MAG: RNA polymerase sigma factor [Pseudomonadales bacterium]